MKSEAIISFKPSQQPTKPYSVVTQRNAVQIFTATQTYIIL